MMELRDETVVKNETITTKDITGKVHEKIVPIPRAYPRRLWWHWIQSRHENKFPIDKSLVGKRVRIGKFIVRTGYYFQPTDIDYDDLKDTINLMMVQRLGEAHPAIQTAVNAIGREETQEIAKNLMGKFGRGMMKRDLYDARAQWIRDIHSLEEYKEYHRLRTFWFVDLRDVDPDETTIVRIESIRRRVIGNQYPASGRYDYWGEWEYDPGGLNHAVHQQVYVCDELSCRNYEDHFYPISVEIHPLDILEVVE